MILPVLLLSSSLVQADCPASAQQVQDAAARVLDAYVSMDEPAYEEASLELHRSVECATEPLTRDVVRDLHMVMALDRFLLGDVDGALGGLRAILDIEPDFVFSSELAPAGHPLRDLLARARSREPHPRGRFLRPIEGVFWLDGSAMGDRAQDQPVLVQWASIDREICWTGYLAAGVGLPVDIVTEATEPGVLARCVEERRVPVAEAPPPVEPVAVSQPEEQDDASLPPIPVLPDAPTLIPSSTETLTEASLPPPERSVLLQPLPLATAGGLVVTTSLLTAALASRHRLLSETDACAIERACSRDPDAALERLGELEQRTRSLGYAAQISTRGTVGLGAAAGITLVF